MDIWKISWLGGGVRDWIGKPWHAYDTSLWNSTDRRPVVCGDIIPILPYVTAQNVGQLFAVTSYRYFLLKQHRTSASCLPWHATDTSFWNSTERRSVVCRDKLPILPSETAQNVGQLFAVTCYGKFLLKQHRTSASCLPWQATVRIRIPHCNITSAFVFYFAILYCLNGTATLYFTSITYM